MKDPPLTGKTSASGSESGERITLASAIAITLPRQLSARIHGSASTYVPYASHLFLASRVDTYSVSSYDSLQGISLEGQTRNKIL